MKTHSEDNKRIAKNSIFLYVRSVIVMLVSLYTSRVVLAALGFADHGLYNLVGSVVVMFNMFSATFVSSTQRFLNVALGQDDTEQCCKVFSASINIHFILAGLLLILMETVGLWVLNNQLNIPEERVLAANIVYQLSLTTFVINLISIPYNAVIIANEKMKIFAFISIYEAMSKLIIAFAIKLTHFDKLITYSILLAFLALSVRIFYGFYCKKKFEQYKYRKTIDKSLYRQMLSISGWNFLGSSASILTVSGMGIIINIFTNVVVNSAKGIASQIENVVKQLVDNFMVSIKPQITKSYASNDSEYLKSLVSRGTRFAFILMSALCVPLIIDAENILKLWLYNVPEYATNFVQYTLIYIMIIPFSNVLDTLLLASGKIKQSQIVLSILQLLNLPFACLILYLEMPPYMIYISYILISYVSLIIRLYFVVQYSCIYPRFYLETIMRPLVVYVAILATLSILVSRAIPFGGIGRFIAIGVITEIVIVILSWFVVLNRNERKKLQLILGNKLNIKIIFNK